MTRFKTVFIPPNLSILPSLTLSINLYPKVINDNGLRGGRGGGEDISTNKTLSSDVTKVFYTAPSIVAFFIVNNFYGNLCCFFSNREDGKEIILADEACWWQICMGLLLGE